MAGRRSTGAAHDGSDAAAPPPRAPSPSAAVLPTAVLPTGSARPAPRAGDVVAGVRLDAPVGRGGAGQVWSGTETGTGARVAVKLLDRSGAGREAALLAAVRHPHVLPLRRVSADPPAVVTELAAGGSLAAQVAARGRLEPGEVVTVLAPLADALAALHARGVVHGDVTATNILFLDRGRPVLADLGVAGLVGDGVPWATPGYAAPEVLAGGRPGPAADVHGLAAAAWLALTGAVPPVEADRLPLVLLAPDCPPGLLATVTAGLDPDPARRPGPGELAAAARAACPGLSVELVPAAALGVRPEEAVTYRVREAAAAEGAPPAGRWHRLVRAVDGAGGRALSRLRRARSADRRAPRASARLACLGVVAAVGAAGVAAGMLGTGHEAGWWPGSPGADGTAPRTVATARAVGAGTPGAGAAGAGAVSTTPPVPAAPPGQAPDDLEATVVDLVAARQRALRAGDAAALVLVHDPLGSTLAADEALVEAGPLEVSYEVLGVRPLPGSPRSALVEVVTTTGGASTTEQVVLELAAADGGWRVRSVSR